MFGNKKKLKELQNRVDKLEDALSKIPKMRKCSECGEIKSKSKFFNEAMPYASFFQSDEYYLDYCDTCKPKVDLRNEAVKAAKDNPEKVLKCVNKGK